MNQPGILELVSFGPDGWGKALLAGAWMTILIALAGYSIGAMIGSFVAWAKISGGRGLRMAPTRIRPFCAASRPSGHLPLLFRRQRACDRHRPYVRRRRLSRLPGFLAGALAVGIVSEHLFTEIFRAPSRPCIRGEIEAAVAGRHARALRFRRIIAPLTLRYACPGSATSGSWS
jgi:octopine/nopaline transport system permease protein